mgnify:CR=1 FL=1
MSESGECNNGFPKHIFLRDWFPKADAACHRACGMSLFDAWDHERGCYVGGRWMCPSNIAHAIMGLYDEVSDDE